VLSQDNLGIEKVLNSGKKKGGKVNRSLTKEQVQREMDAHSLSPELVTVLDPAGMASEAYRTLSTNLLCAPVYMSPKVVVITSLRPMEGKSATCANLGVVLAQAEKSTLIMDCDFRRPTLHSIFGLDNSYGVSSVLAGECDLPQVCQEPLPGLKIAAAGPLPSNPPAELLTSKRFAEIVDRMRQEFDYVLIDSPPKGQVSDPVILASKGDGVLLILEAKKTRKGPLLKFKRSLEAVGANVLGTVVTNVKGGKSR
jgi:capsular exopolysaccharide synthesis family protein